MLMIFDDTCVQQPLHDHDDDDCDGEMQNICKHEISFLLELLGFPSPTTNMKVNITNHETKEPPNVCSVRTVRHISRTTCTYTSAKSHTTYYSYVH